MATVFVVCKLPNGIIIEHPADKKMPSVELFGRNNRHKGKVILNQLLLEDYGVTEVDKDLWDAWELANMDFAPYAAGFIFAAKTKKDAELEANSRSRDLTGVEQLDPDKIDNGVSVGI